jgi:asparagine N-glycosylation enzyme membrane subunit Stt3
MQTSAETLPAVLEQDKAAAPPVGVIVLIFWFAFAAAAGITAVMNPAMLERQDPDSFMRLVQVHDLLQGQAWFDLVQHRLDPPHGILMHWSRLIDAPLALLALAGGLFDVGDQVALIAWPLILLLGFMASAAAVATALHGRGAVVPALLLTLLFFDPLLIFMPGDIDHHNAQITLVVATIACLIRMRDRPGFGFAAGMACAVSTAIGLEKVLPTALFGLAAA